MLFYHISGLVVSVIDSSVVDCGFEPLSDESKSYEIGIYCFSSTCGMLFQ